MTHPDQNSGFWPDQSASRVTIVREKVFTATANNGAQGAVPLFTLNAGPSGRKGIFVHGSGGIVTTTCVGASGTLAYGVTGNTGLFIAATAVAQLATGTPTWVSTTGTAGGLAMPAGAKEVLVVDDVIATVATTDFSAGRIFFFVQYSAVVPGSFLTLT